ncbi:MAG: type II secretion system protein [bacterium]
MTKLRGFTIIEVIVTIGIFSFILVAMMIFVSNSYVSFFKLQDKTSVLSRARLALERLIGEFREAQSGDNGAYSLAIVSPNEIAFYSNIDSDSGVERVHYWLSGGTLWRGIIDPVGMPADYPAENEITNIITEFVDNGATPTFTYYDGTFTGTQNPLIQPVNSTSVRHVGFFVSIDETPGEKLEAVVIESSATLRNLKDNL